MIKFVDHGIEFSDAGEEQAAISGREDRPDIPYRTHPLAYAEIERLTRQVEALQPQVAGMASLGRDVHEMMCLRKQVAALQDEVAALQAPPTRFANAANIVSTARANAANVVNRTVNSVNSVNTPSEQPVNTDVHIMNSHDRKAYRREWMRKSRAAKKAKA